MAKYRIFIVEDNLPFAIKLEQALLKWEYDVIGIASNSEEALAVIKKEQPEIILMDIYIEGDFNGIEIVNQMKNVNSAIIFMTAEKNEETYKEAINANVVNFLIKPFSMLTLRAAIDLAIKKQAVPNPSEQNQYPLIYVKKNNELVKINTRDINWIKSDLNYCDLYLKDTRLTIRTSMIRFYNKQLPKNNFIQVHKSFIVRIEAIDKINLGEKTLTIKDQIIPIGRSYRKNLLNKISPNRLKST
jgi:DNA-binding LytR/AlgR family response regulator